MTRKQAVEAVLIPPQLDAFCKRFRLRAEEIEPIFSGWSKHILMSSEYVFLFPRHPKFERWLDVELSLYQVFADFDDVPLPKLIETVEDADLSYYRFGVVTRMPGVIFSSIELDLSPDEYASVLRQLGRLTAIWHDVPIDQLPDAVDPVVFDESWAESEFHRWLHLALSPKTVLDAWGEVCGLVEQLVKEVGNTRFDVLVADSKRETWRAIMVELANLSPVLIHGDVHEDQFFVRSKSDLEITGLIDWGTAAIGNPVLDFNFGEWGVDIWRYREHFGQFRRAMWRDYLDARNIALSTVEGLHVFYTLHEAHCAATSAKASAVYGSLEEQKENVLRRLLKAVEGIPYVSSQK